MRNKIKVKVRYFSVEPPYLEVGAPYLCDRLGRSANRGGQAPGFASVDCGSAEQFRGGESDAGFVWYPILATLQLIMKREVLSLEDIGKLFVDL